MADIIGVIYPPGASGEFIKSILVYHISDDNTEINFSDGTSHDYYKTYCSNNIIGLLLRHNKKNNRFYGYIKTLMNNVDYTLIDSFKLNNASLSYIFKELPQYKLLCINITDDDLYYVSFNHFFKQPLTRPQFVELALMCFPDTEFDKLTIEQQKLLILHEKILEGYLSYKEKLNNELQSITNQFENSIYYINFKDIIENKQQVINVLETITGKKLSGNTLRQYDRYIQRQLDFRKEKGI